MSTKRTARTGGRKPPTPDDPHRLTAERLAALLEVPETPPAVQDLIRQACHSIDDAAAMDEINRTPGDVDDVDRFYVFGKPADITPDEIRRQLADRLRRVGRWRLCFADLDWIEKGDGDE